MSRRIGAAILLGVTGAILATTSFAQEKPADAAKPEAAKVVIADEPKLVDAATLVDAKLRQNATVTFEEASLSEVAAWIQKTTGFNVALDVRSLEAAGLDGDSPITERLQDAPIYLLLDRLERFDIAWRLQDRVLTLDARSGAQTHFNIQYNVGDLLDQGFEGDELQSVLRENSGVTDWSQDGGTGQIALLGDVLFVRQTSRNHRRIAGLLEGLRKPARRTVIDEPVVHVAIRASLDRPANVKFAAKPLAAAIEELSKNAAIDIRLDRIALRSGKITERTPVTFELTEQSLRTTLNLLVAKYKLSWVVRDGAVWITTDEESRNPANLRSAVFDVRDLCPDTNMSTELGMAIQDQADSCSWEDDGDIGSLAFAKSGIMVVSQAERGLDSIQTLLENYRVALRNSKRRVNPDSDPESVIKRYYRMPTEVAVDLEKELPTLLAPGTWKSEKTPMGVGSIRRLQSWRAAAPTTDASKGEVNTDATSYSILIIEQKRKVHTEFADLLHKIQFGEGGPAFGGGMGGMGGGMGGMGGGGGFF